MKKNEQIETFFERLERLDAGARARLKRNAGNPLAESRSGALGLFYNLLPPGVPRHQEEKYFLVATLYPIAESGGQGSLGEALRRARNKDNEKGLNRRVEILLDADEKQLPFRLRQAVRFLHSHRVPLDWRRLLQDLLSWNSPKRFVQQQWARSYFAD
ncbi:MAG: type I-E CRISPR-associated protein Cse2/CasB [Anaerolineae bacterium]|jgi:CRISPR system Cascade subunit CasB